MSFKISRRAKGIGAIVVVIGTVILSWIGLGIFVPEINNLENLPHRIYRVVKIAMGGDPTADAKPAANVPWQLLIVKILVVIILIVTVFKIIQKVFYEQYTMLRLLFKRGHTIVCGIDAKGLQTLRDHQKSWGGKAVGIEIKHENEKAKTAKKEGHPIIWGDVKEAETLLEAGVTRASNLICFLPGEQNGIEVLSTVYDIYEKKKPANQLNCYLQLNNARLIEVIERAEHLAHYKNVGLDVRFFNFNKMIARHLFRTFAVKHFDDIATLSEGKFFRIILLGFGNLGKALLLQALRVLHFYSSAKTEIITADKNIGGKRKKFEEEYPFASEIFKISFVEFDGTYKELLKGCTDCGNTNAIPVVITAFENNDENLELALEILDYTPEDSFRIYTKNTDSKNVASLLKKAGNENRRLNFFGDLETFCRMEYITGKEQDRMAQLIHNDYLKLQRETVASESARYKTPWEDLLEDARDANRAQADHLIFKLAQAGIKNADAAAISFTAEQVEGLAIAEHQRWNAHRQINGWQYGALRNDIKKLHPSIVSWDALSEAEKQKDRDTVLRIPILIKESKEMV